MLTFITKLSPRNKDFFCLACILIISAIASHPLFKAQIIDFNDSFVALVKTVGVTVAWQEGDRLARWMPDINAGYGYPLLNFYPPLFSYLSALASLLTQNYMIGTNIVWIAGFFFSGVTMFYLAREFWGRLGALLSATAYIYVPFHFCDIYIRAASAQFLTWVFIPLVIWRFYRLSADMRPATFIAASLSFAGLLLAHNGIAVLFTPVLIAYILFLFIMDKARSLKKLASSCGAFLFSFALTAYYWLPAFVEKQYVMIDKIAQGNWDFHLHMMKDVYQLLFAAWTYAHWGMGYGRPFSIGWGHLLLATIALAGIPFIWHQYRRQARHMAFWALAAVFTGFLTLKASTPVWETFSFLVKYVAAPWRLFVVLTFILSFLAGGLLMGARGWLRWSMVPAAILFIIFINFSFIQPQYGMRAFDLKDPRQFLFNNRPMDNMEFLPKTVRNIPVSVPANRYEILLGQARITRQERISGLRHELEIQALTPAAVCFYHFYFPGWKVLVDGVPTTIRANNPQGLIMFEVPAGKHIVEITFGQTPIRIWGACITWLALLSWPAFLVWRSRSVKKTPA